MDPELMPQIFDDINTKQEHCSEKSFPVSTEVVDIINNYNIQVKNKSSDENIHSNETNLEIPLELENKLEINGNETAEIFDNTPIDPNDIKEPEEPDHNKHCPELFTNESHDNIGVNHSINSDVNHNVNSDESFEDKLKCKEEDETGKWTLILGHDQIKKRVIKEGDETSARPRNGQLIQVRCSGRLDDGTLVDVHDKLEITLGEDDFINAFDLCIPLMHQGEVCQLVTEARFAYGEKGRDSDIPGDARITYELELLDARDQPPYSSMSLLQRTTIGDRKRERGNELYIRGEHSRSIGAYDRALKALGDDESHNNNSEDDPSLLQTWLDARIKCYNNIAAAQMKVEAWEAAGRSCDQVLKVQPNNVKALFRKGKCLVNQRDTNGAVSCLKRALELDPDSKIILQELQRLEKKKQQENEMERNLYKKMLGGQDGDAGTKKQVQSSSGSKWMWYGIGAVSMAGLSVLLMAYHRWSN